MKRILPLLIATLTPWALIGCNSLTKDINISKESTGETLLESTATAKSLTDNWKTYTARDNSYTVKFPGQPQEQNQSTNTPLGSLNFLIVSYGDNAKGRAYMTTHVTYPVNPSNYNVEKGLDGARDGAARNTNSTILSEKKISYDGHPGREITMRNETGITQRAKIFIDPQGPTLYQILVVAEDGNVDFPEADAFLNSLVISK
ncbi:MAG: PsbP-related protein [Xenococcaceae cyanobacterium]